MIYGSNVNVCSDGAKVGSLRTESLARLRRSKEVTSTPTLDFNFQHYYSHHSESDCYPGRQQETSLTVHLE